MFSEIKQRIEAATGKRPFDVLIENVRIANVFDGSSGPGCIGILGDRIAYAGGPQPDFSAAERLDGKGRWALPGFIDSHMHLESSMVYPGRFARLALQNGTTTVCADPHEICNVLGRDGLRRLIRSVQGLPLRVLIMAPSTIPSAPGFENSGYAVSGAEMDAMLTEDGVLGIGEVMDFNGVADGEEPILSVVEEGLKRGCLIDGHASVLTGRRLQAFRAAGIDSDHTPLTGDKVREELALGFFVQLQGIAMKPDVIGALKEAKVTDRVSLVTDDVSCLRLVKNGHLNSVYARAVALGLDPMDALRYVTVNPARRLRLNDLGGIAPGMKADLQLVRDIEKPLPDVVFFDGRKVYEKGVPFETFSPCEDPFEGLDRTLKLPALKPEDFRLTVCPPEEIMASAGNVGALVNGIAAKPDDLHTKAELLRVPVKRVSQREAELLPERTGLLRLAVFNRYGLRQKGMALLSGFPAFSGAVAVTYGHDSHNLTVLGREPSDMAAAANALVDCGGGFALSAGNAVQAVVPLPVAGILSREEPETLCRQMEAFVSLAAAAGLVHDDLIAFLTLLTLAVSAEIRCTDRGLVDVVHKKMLPLVSKYYTE